MLAMALERGRLAAWLYRAPCPVDRLEFQCPGQRIGFGKAQLHPVAHRIGRAGGALPDEGGVGFSHGDFADKERDGEIDLIGTGLGAGRGGLDGQQQGGISGDEVERAVADAFSDGGGAIGFVQSQEEIRGRTGERELIEDIRDAADGGRWWNDSANTARSK